MLTLYIYICIYLYACMLNRFSCFQLFVTLWTVVHQASQSMGFSRFEYWSELPCPPPGDPPNSGIEPESPEAPMLQADSLPLSHQVSLCMYIYMYIYNCKQMSLEWSKSLSILCKMSYLPFKSCSMRKMHFCRWHFIEITGRPKKKRRSATYIVFITMFVGYVLAKQKALQKSLNWGRHSTLHKTLIDVSGSSVNGTNVELDPVMFKLQSSLLLAEPGFPLKSVVDCAGITQWVNSLVFRFFWNNRWNT